MKHGEFSPLIREMRPVKLTKTMDIPPFSTIEVHGITKVKGHDKKVNLIVEPMKNRPNPSAVVVLSFTDIKPGSSKVNMNLKNFTSIKITVKAKSIVAWIATANVVPPMLTRKFSRIRRTGRQKWNPPI